METEAAPAQSPEILETPQELARALRTTPQTVNAWHRQGVIPARFAVGRIVRFERREVIEALAARSRKPEAAASGAAR
jgi:excisionase family DNA binding protein